MPRMTIGARLTLWYAGVLAASLASLGAVVFFAFSRNLLTEIDRALDEELAEIEMEVVAAPDAETRDRQLQKYFGSHGFYEIQVARPDGEVIFRSDTLVDHPLTVPPLDDRPAPALKESVVPGGGEPIRLASRVAVSFDGPVIIQTADSLTLYYRERRQLLAVILTAAPLMLLLAAGGGYWLSRRALAPVDQLTRAAIGVSAARLDRRVDAPRTDDELGRLAAAFNQMLARLEQSFLEIQRFTADAAHELRTPLAVLRNEAEVALRTPRSADGYRDVLRSQLEEIERLTRLADQLLFLCREDAGPPPHASPVRLGALLATLGEQMQPVAQARGLSLRVDGVPDSAVEVDPDRLQRLFANLLDNALKYTPPGGDVWVSGRRDNGSIEIAVADNGIGVPAEQQSKLFERFYRADPARRDRPGAGLGLAICRSIVQRHGGTIRLDSAPGVGTTVRVTLPVKAMDEDHTGPSTDADCHLR